MKFLNIVVALLSPAFFMFVFIALVSVLLLPIIIGFYMKISDSILLMSQLVWIVLLAGLPAAIRASK